MKLLGAVLTLMLLVAGCGPPPAASAEALAVRKHVVQLQEHLAENGMTAAEEQRAQRLKVLNNLQRSAALHREGLSEAQTAAVRAAIEATHAYCTFEPQTDTLPMEIIRLEADCTVALSRAAEVLLAPAQSRGRAKVVRERALERTPPGSPKGPDGENVWRTSPNRS
jgi:hypothetical protein